MIPMITNIEEVIQAKKLLKRFKEELDKEK